MNQIKLVTSPVIEHKFLEAGKNVALRIKELNLENQVATDETIQTLKSLRSELNKEKAAIDKDVKLALSPVTNAIDSVKESYKLNIKKQYDEAEAILKDKIGVFETNVKREKEESIKDYFEQLKESYDVPFLKFENLNLTINLSTTLKKYQEQAINYVNKIVEDLELIETQEHKAEILTEYKKTLNVSNSITTVSKRIEAVKLEQEAIIKRDLEQKVRQLTDIGLKLDEMTKVFCFNNEPIIKECDLSGISKSDFSSRIKEIKEFISPAPIKEDPIKAPIKEVAKPIVKEEKPIIEHVKEEPKKEIVKESITEEIVKANFEVKGTFKQLKALSLYMKDNNLTYKNI